jgi:hypothetical protein
MIDFFLIIFEIFIICVHVLPINLTHHMDIIFGKWYILIFPFLYLTGFFFSTSYISFLLCFEFAHKIFSWNFMNEFDLDWHFHILISFRST